MPRRRWFTGLTSRYAASFAPASVPGLMMREAKRSPAPPLPPGGVKSSTFLLREQRPFRRLQQPTYRLAAARPRGG